MAVAVLPRWRQQFPSFGCLDPNASEVNSGTRAGGLLDRPLRSLIILFRTHHLTKVLLNERHVGRRFK
jgi:hypothetical protein